MKPNLAGLASKICVVGVVLLAGAFAQAQTTRTNRAGGLRDFPRGGEMSGTSRFTPGLERLMGVLTDEQKTSLRKAMESLRDQTSGLEEKLRSARREMFESALGKSFDEETVRGKAMAAAKLDAELTVLRMKAFSQIDPPLTQQQRASLRGPGEASGEIRGVRPRRGTPPVDENGLPPKNPPPGDK